MSRELGQMIEYYLRKRRMTRKDLAAKTGLTEAAISRYINGLREPKAVTLSGIAQALEIPISALLSSTDYKEASNNDVVRLVARNANSLSPEEKQYLINVLSQS